MLSKIDPAWLMMAIATVAVLSYFFGAALDALMRDDSFGSFGNAIIMCGGFFLAILAANSHGYVLHGLHVAVLVGLGGAFLLLTTLALARALVKRL
jgi:hypothetical protein